MLYFAFGMGPVEMALLLVIVLILFGAGRLPQVFQSLGEGMKKFRDAQRDAPSALDVTPEKPQLDAEPAHEVNE